MRWQPIETAPDTGPILVVNMNAREPAVCWAGIRSSRVGWWETTRHVSIEPTHWMPLPAPPPTETQLRRMIDACEPDDARLEGFYAEDERGVDL